MKKALILLGSLLIWVSPIIAQEVTIGGDDAFTNDPWCGG